MPCSPWWITSCPPLPNFKEDSLKSGKRNWFDRAVRVVAGPPRLLRDAAISPDSVLPADPGSGLAVPFALGVCLSSPLIYTHWQQADNLSSLLPLSGSHGTVRVCVRFYVYWYTHLHLRESVNCSKEKQSTDTVWNKHCVYIKKTYSTLYYLDNAMQ